MSNRITWQSVAVLAVLGAVGVALAAFTELSAGEITGMLGILGGVAIGPVVAQQAVGQVSDRVEQIQKETAQQTPVLQRMAHRINGDLDLRINTAMEEAAEMGAGRALAALRAEGVIRGSTVAPPPASPPHPWRG